MFKPISAVQKHILKTQRPGSQVTLESVTGLVCGLTAIDAIVFVGYEAPRENPIWGGFQRWNRHPSVYAGLETLVEIRYANHLDENWYRFVVCKELCHALDASVGAHVNTESAADNLVDFFSLASSAEQLPTLLSGRAEMLAEAGALELLCPLPWRRQMLADGPVDTAKVAASYGIPNEYADGMFRPKYMEAVEWLLSNG